MDWSGEHCESYKLAIEEQGCHDCCAVVPRVLPQGLLVHLEKVHYSHQLDVKTMEQLLWHYDSLTEPTPLTDFSI